MTAAIVSPVSAAEVIETRRLSLVPFTRAHMAALAGRAGGTFEGARFDVPEGWAEEEAWLLGLRLNQIDEDPAVEEWLMRAITFRGRREMIGHAGFHGPSDPRGYVEIGYTVFEPFRRTGIAHETAVGLLEWAGRQPGIAGFRASVSPGNAPSLGLVAKLGFVQTGVRCDEIDGEELVFERPAPL